MREIPKKLLEYQEQTRAETEHKVLCAIEELKAEGYTVRIKDLVEYTGLSRSVFAKPHIRKLLENYEIGNPLPKDSKQDGQIRRDKVEERIKRLTEENTELKKECELLRGRLFLLMQKEEK